MSQKLQILLVEDTPSLSILYKSYLDELDGALHHIADGTEALQFLRSQKVDLLFLDLHLPGISGLEILEQLRPERPIPPTIIITANDTVKTAIEAMRLGASDYLVKPFGRERVVTTAQNVLRMKSLENNIEALRAELKKPIL